MAESDKENKNKFDTEEKKKPEKKIASASSDDKKPRAEILVRVISTDIPGNFTVYHGLTRIKGISWAFSNAICSALKIPREKKMAELSEKEIDSISKFIKEPNVPEWLLNRRKDEETGISKHLVTSDLDYAREFDIRKMKKIKCYKGWRHALGQPVRGQRTRSHFRKGGSIGVIKTKTAQGQAAAKAAGSKESKK